LLILILLIITFGGDYLYCIMRDRLLAGLQPFYLPVLLKWRTSTVLEAVLKNMFILGIEG
jgi:hypothetical protein